ncbi:MAG: 2Fe-2S iron-sulfur cluster binding domain-containing protein [Oscillospiraceae bacterium]|nr:2Fe-2S iron-sulfur cluster binding domain-containing protein [Oscillospiraceae bacterium]
MAVNVKVGLIGALDMLKFKNMSKVREAAIQAAPAKEITADYPINQKAKALHPDYQKLVVSKIINHTGAGAKTFVLESADDSPLAYFRAGQYLSLKLKLGDSVLSRPYSISSAPKDALAGRYELTVRANPGGFAADRLLEDAKVGDIFFASAPQGNFYYEELRDPKNILALAGGSGITPFLSMARAIIDGTEDFNLTILFGSRTEDQILFKGELAELTRNDKIHVIHVLSDEEKPGFEHGFLTAELVNKYAPEDYSLFICGPEAMYRFLDAELEKLALPRKNVRRELLGVTKNIAAHPEFPASAKGMSYTITVRQGPRETAVSAIAEEPILVALERAGLTVPSRCRSGECGWCRSKVIAGEFFVPPENESRRYADKTSGYIHPCATFPLSDMVLEVPGEYVGE